jgi:hypothetical protein
VLLFAPRPASQVQFREQLRHHECRTRYIISGMGSRVAMVHVFLAPKYPFRPVV